MKLLGKTLKINYNTVITHYNMLFYEEPVIFSTPSHNIFQTTAGECNGQDRQTMRKCRQKRERMVVGGLLETGQIHAQPFNFRSFISSLNDMACERLCVCAVHGNMQQELALYFHVCVSAFVLLHVCMSKCV